ncbi:aminomethyl-transferring glycine dehydrogenase subunit GcvPA [Candidatus Hodarchaeum mangrovi]
MTFTQRFIHPYLPQTDAQIKSMLDEIGISSIEELFSDIPINIRFSKELDLPNMHSEQETINRIRKILSKNVEVSKVSSFLGAGIYYQAIPAIINAILSRSEFYTAYTPYAPEISQGMLQGLWEYQSMIAELTQLDFVNSSMYDMATALGEAALMCTRTNGKNVFLVPSAIQPERYQTLETYASGANISVIKYPFNSNTGATDISALEELLKMYKGKISGVYTEHPNFFGVIETKINEISKIVHQNDALFVVGIDPISLGILKSPGEYEADIAIGEGQSLGLPMNFGGPLLGLFAVKNDIKLSRTMPGRIIGLTTEKKSEKRAFIMTLQTREQHIRREKATSNICTNNALCALASAVYLSTIGMNGLKQLARINISKTNYLIQQMKKIKILSVPVFSNPHFREFVFQLNNENLQTDFENHMFKNDIYLGYSLKKFYPNLGTSYLSSATEMTQLFDIQHFISQLNNFQNITRGA